MESTAIPFIAYDSHGYSVCPEALAYLASLPDNLGVVSIVGKYRTGKSFLLNKVILQTNGFGVGPTINPCTKGIWLWPEPLSIPDDCGTLRNVIVMDSEGFGAYREDTNHDTRLFLLSLLLSSHLIYNSIGSIDEAALTNLSLYVSLSQQLQNRQSSLTEYSENNPNFLWVLRDFALKLEDTEGTPITPKEYLENALSYQSPDITDAKSQLRKVLRNAFRHRDCCVLVRPTENENELQQLQHLPDAVFRSEFLEQAARLRNKILNEVKAKTVNGCLVTGEMLGQLAVSYVEAINAGSVPCITGVWANLCRFESEKLLMTLIGRTNGPELPCTEACIHEYFQQARKECEAELKRKVMGDDTQEWTDKLRSAFKDLKKNRLAANTRHWTREVTQQLQAWHTQAFDALKTEEWTSLDEFLTSLSACADTLDCPIVTVNAYIQQTKFEYLKEATSYFARVQDLSVSKELTRAEYQVELATLQSNLLQQELSDEKSKHRETRDSLEAEISELRPLVLANELKSQELSKILQKTTESYEERILHLKDNLNEQTNTLKNKYDEQQQKINLLQAKLLQLTSQAKQQTALASQRLSFKQAELDSALSSLSELAAAHAELQSQATFLEEESLAKLATIKSVLERSEGFRCTVCTQCFDLEEFADHDCSKPISQAVQVSVTQALMRGHDKPYTQYSLSVKTSAGTSRVHRRFAMICNLHIAIRQNFPHLELPSCAGFLSVDKSLRDCTQSLPDRAAAIETYLNHLARTPEINQSVIFRKFLGIEVLQSITNI